MHTKILEISLLSKMRKPNGHLLELSGVGFQKLKSIGNKIKYFHIFKHIMNRYLFYQKKKKKKKKKIHFYTYLKTCNSLKLASSRFEFSSLEI